MKVGKEYYLKGDIYNGYKADGTQRITKETVSRKVTAIRNDVIVCICSRYFIINENLKVYEVDYENYN